MTQLSSHLPLSWNQFEFNNNINFHNLLSYCILIAKQQQHRIKSVITVEEEEKAETYKNETLVSMLA